MCIKDIWQITGISATKSSLPRPQRKYVITSDGCAGCKLVAVIRPIGHCWTLREILDGLNISRKVGQIVNKVIDSSHCVKVSIWSCFFHTTSECKFWRERGIRKRKEGRCKGGRRERTSSVTTKCPASPTRVDVFKMWNPLTSLYDY